MRRTLAAGLALAFAAATLAFAAAPPAEVKLGADGAFTDQAGRPLYTFTLDTMRMMSHCEAACAKAWPPLLAASEAQAAGDWYTVPRVDGSHQWAYKNHPLYTYAKDTPGQRATGVSENWILARP